MLKAELLIVHVICPAFVFFVSLLHAALAKNQDKTNRFITHLTNFTFTSTSRLHFRCIYQQQILMISTIKSAAMIAAISVLLGSKC